MTEYRYVKNKVDLNQLAKEIKASTNLSLFEDNRDGYLTWSAPDNLVIHIKDNAVLDKTALDNVVSSHIPKLKKRVLRVRFGDGRIEEIEVLGDVER